MKLFHLQCELNERLVHKLQLAENEAQARERAVKEDPCWQKAEFVSGVVSEPEASKIRFYVADEGSDANFIWSEPCLK